MAARWVMLVAAWLAVGFAFSAWWWLVPVVLFAVGVYAMMDSNSDEKCPECAAGDGSLPKTCRIHS